MMHKLVTISHEWKSCQSMEISSNNIRATCEEKTFDDKDSVKRYPKKQFYLHSRIKARLGDGSLTSSLTMTG